MLEILRQLNGSPGINGSLVVAADGLVITSCLGEEVDGDATAALVGDVVGSAIEWLQSGGHAEPSQMVVNASRGKIVVHSADTCFLVVLTSQFVDLDVTHLEIASAARLVARRACLSH